MLGRNPLEPHRCHISTVAQFGRSEADVSANILGMALSKFQRLVLLAVILLQWLCLMFNQRTISNQRKSLDNVLSVMEKQNDALKKQQAAMEQQNRTIDTLRHLCGGSQAPPDSTMTGQ
jgi:hypothetical protein